MPRLTAIALLAAAGPAALANAQDLPPHSPKTLGALVAGSQLAFRGEVVGVEYANSLPAADAPEGIPHTFVTYRIDEVYRGAAPGGEITLRFMGGWDPVTQTYLHVSLAPEFDLGDTDILFVRGNGSLGAPLVGNRAGRLRINHDQVYTDTGRSVRLDDTGRLSFGERYSLPEVGSVHVMGATIILGLDPEAIVGPSDAMPAGALGRMAAEIAARTAPPAEPCVSVAVGRAFESPFPEPAPMRDRIAQRPDDTALDAEMIAEILADESGLAPRHAGAPTPARTSDR